MIIEIEPVLERVQLDPLHPSAVKTGLELRFRVLVPWIHRRKAGQPVRVPPAGLLNKAVVDILRKAENNRSVNAAGVHPGKQVFVGKRQALFPANMIVKINNHLFLLFLKGETGPMQPPVAPYPSP